jgi:hypothetical protein
MQIILSCLITAALTLLVLVLHRDGLQVTALRLRSFLRDLVPFAKIRHRLAGDPLLRMTLERASEDGLEDDADQFEFMAAMRDTSLAQLTELFSQQADVFEMAALERYISTPDVAFLEIIEPASATTSPLQMLRCDPLAKSLPTTVPSLLPQIGATASLTEIVSDTEAMLRQRLGNTPDIPTLAAVLLYLESQPQITLARATLEPELSQSTSLLQELLQRHPETGRPYVSVAEMDTGPV